MGSAVRTCENTHRRQPLRTHKQQSTMERLQHCARLRVFKQANVSSTHPMISALKLHIKEMCQASQSIYTQNGSDTQTRIKLSKAQQQPLFLPSDYFLPPQTPSPIALYLISVLCFSAGLCKHYLFSPSISFLRALSHTHTLFCSLVAYLAHRHSTREKRKEVSE